MQFSGRILIVIFTENAYCHVQREYLMSCSERILDLMFRENI